MIVNITKGSDPYGLCRYLLGKELGGKKPNSHYLGGNMSGQDATELAEEFRFSHDLNRRVEKNMIHYSVSLPPGERVDNETMVKISEDLLFLMGHWDASSYERLVKDKKRPEDVYRDEEALTQFFIVQHLDRIEDTDCQHWHVAASRVRLDGTLTRDSFERYRVREAERWLEQTYNLTQKKERSLAEQKNLTTGEYRQKKRTEKKLPKEKLWEAIDQATEDSPTIPEFISRLKDQGIDAQVKYTRAGEAKGISYFVDGIAFSGTKLGAAYTFPGLQKHRKVSYEAERDDEAIKELNSRPPAEPNDTQQPQVQLQKISAEQREKAEQVYPVAWSIFQKALHLGKALEETSGTWVYRGENYALCHVRENDRFSISNRERGELARYEAGKVQSAQAIGQQDLEILQRHDSAQQQRELLERQKQKEQQARHRKVDYER